MAGRKKSPAQNRREHHSAQVRTAETGKRRLLAYAQWLTALAWDCGPADVTAASDLIRGRIRELDPYAAPLLEELPR